jgi:hypothetical protein
MNGRISKKIHKEVKSNISKTINDVFDNLNTLPLKKRISLAIKLIFKKL